MARERGGVRPYAAGIALSVLQGRAADRAFQTDPTAACCQGNMIRLAIRDAFIVVGKVHDRLTQ
jgi:hypothetical protein